MTDTVSKALASDRVIDITTTGRTTGEPRKIEIWYHRIGGRFYITGTPGRPRSWYANLVAEPAFTFHLKQSVTADLAATARPITDPSEREEVFGAMLPGMTQFTSQPGTEPAVWIAESPLVEVSFES